MTKKRALAFCLFLALVCTSCGAKAESPASSAASLPEDGLKQCYLQNISYQIPAHWTSESAVQGTYHTAPDGGIFYVNTANHAPFDMDVEEYAVQALDKTTAYLERSMNGFSAVKQEDFIFLDCYARKTWFSIDFTASEDEDTPTGSATMFSLMFADRKQVYNMIFTMTSPEVKEALPEIIQSVTVAQKQN